MRFAFPVILFAVVGFLLTISLYLLLSKQHVQVDLPRPAPTFSVATPPRESLVGAIASVSGIVLWESRTADAPVVVTKPQKLQQGEEVDSTTGSATVTFLGVSAVLAKDTKLRIIQTLPASIVLDQTAGSILYTISSVQTPVSLRLLDLLLTANNVVMTVTLGTATAKVTLQVASGSATAAYTDTNFVSKLLTLQKGDEVRYNNDSKKAVILP